MDTIVTYPETVEVIFVQPEGGAGRLVETDQDKHQIFTGAEPEVMLATSGGGGPEQVATEPCPVLAIESREIGPQGAPGGVGIWLQAGEVIGGHRALTVDESGRAIYADHRTVDHGKRLVGISINAADTGGRVLAIRAGEMEEQSWSWDVEKPIYLGRHGRLVQETPEEGVSVILGFPTRADRMVVNIGEPIILAN